MKLPVIQGVIRRRILVNFRVDPAVIARQLPAPFRPKLHSGHAIAGVCLIRLDALRPRLVPSFLGFSSENAAHRIAVVWETEAGETKEGVFVPRRDTGALLNRLAGARVFPGEHHAARFTVEEGGDAIDLRMRSDDGQVTVRVRGKVAAAEAFAKSSSSSSSSCFSSLAEASAFFEPGSLGYSVTRDAGRLDGLELRTRGWKVEPLEVEEVCSSYFADPAKFPPGSAEFDCALIMRGLAHEWHANDRARCRSAGIPDDVVYRAKWRIALDLLERSRREGVPMAWLSADEAYGRVGEFRETVAALGLSYVVEIPSSLSGWTRQPEIEPAGTVTASGRTLTKARVAVGEKEARQVSRLWQRGGPSWKQYQIKTTQKGPVVWEVRETRFFPNHDGVPGAERRLLVLREVLSGEVKYFLSNAKSEVPLKTLLYVAFSRWHIERLFEDGKGEVGFDHFEVRCYRSLMRHLVLSMLSLYFLCEQSERLRGEKPLVDAFAGEDGGRGATGSGEVAA